jgi:hypothetical protein
MIKTNKSEPGTSVIINELNIRSVDRSRKDIATWRHALIAAESAYFPNRTRLYDLYDDILLDGHLAGIVAKRIDAVLNKELCFEVDGKRQAHMEPLIQSAALRTIIRTVLETRLWGISALEFIPGADLACTAIPRKHIKPAQQLIAWEQSGTTGISYTDLENVWVIGDPADLGILLRCAPYCLYKRGGLADWAQFIELFGQPVRVIKYDSYDEQTRAELKKILDESGSALSMMIPRQADFEIKDGKQTNCDGNLQLSFIKAMNEELSITVLGNTETTSSSYSSGYAQSRVHLEQQYEITLSDMVYVSSMLNSSKFLGVLEAYGYPVANGRFSFTAEKDVDYLQKRMAIDKELAKLTAITDKYWQDTYGISRAA